MYCAQVVTVDEGGEWMCVCVCVLIYSIIVRQPVNREHAAAEG